MMKFIWCILVLFTPLQAAELVGIVTDAESKKPLQGVTVRLDGGVATETDTAGMFQFVNRPSQIHRLRISHVSYEPVVRELRLDSLHVKLAIGLVPKVFLLDELSVTAEPVGINDVHQNPSFVTVIPRTHFEGREVSLPDVLSEATGVQVKRLGGLGAFSTLSLRGSSAEQVEVYLDGVLLNAALGGGVDLSNLPLAHVGQIEVYRGAGAAGNGLGGTVHIRTRETKKKFSQSVRGAWGSFDTRSLNGMVTGGFGQTKFLFAADYMASDNNFGFLDDNGTEYNVNDDVFTSRQNNAYESVNVLGKWRKDWENGRHVTLQESLFWKSQGIPGISNNQAQNAHFGAFRSLTELAFEVGEILPSLMMRHTFHFTHVGESFVDANGEIGVGRRDNYYRTRTLGWQTRLQVLSPQAFTTTLGVLRESYVPMARLQSSASLFDSQRWTLSGRAGIDWPLPADLGVWSFSADVRHLRSSFQGANPFAFSPLAPDSANTRNLLGLRSGLRMNVTGHLMAKANVGRSLRAPSFYELFGDRGGVVGNVNLQPERGFTWDVGLRYAMGGVTLESVFFDHHYQDLIQFV
ncbi:MAG: TonB-dependent receptor, partial [Candidatus Latescibacteria bacterium]|nr:TonB-dependent receptor [Candidatus Latescibacterota bacterium]